MRLWSACQLPARSLLMPSQCRLDRCVSVPLFHSRWLLILSREFAVGDVSKRGKTEVWGGGFLPSASEPPPPPAWPGLRTDLHNLSGAWWGWREGHGPPGLHSNLIRL